MTFITFDGYTTLVTTLHNAKVHPLPNISTGSTIAIHDQFKTNVDGVKHRQL